MIKKLARIIHLTYKNRHSLRNVKGMRTWLRLLYKKLEREHSIASVIEALKNGWTIKLLDNDFMFEKGDIKLIQPNVGATIEDIASDYKCNYNGKTVMDIGGYMGLTAVMFVKSGAKEVIVFEPVAEHVKYIQKNIKLNRVDKKVKVVRKAVSKRDGYIIIRSSTPIGTGGFGIKPGKVTYKAPSISWDTLLKEAIKKKVDIIKSDCEGCEKYLVDVDCKKIKKIKYWIIEMHGENVIENLTRKFTSCGFSKKIIRKLEKSDPKTEIAHFSLKNKQRRRKL
ncbi:hypothetical protein DRN75_02090 [Nanoarchaeota archaeon]|nr:MAG: hypothetical protein DRN75_02090 [Nanoarchaeota archaeon]